MRKNIASKNWVDSEKLWECSNCHAEIDEDEKSCWNCNAVFKSDIELDDNKSISPLFRIVIGVVAGIVVYIGLTAYSKINVKDKNINSSIEQTANDQNNEVLE